MFGIFVFKLRPSLLIRFWLIKPLEQLAPLASERLPETRQVIDCHVPGTCFDSLQRAEIDLGALREPLLRQILAQPYPIDIAGDDHVGFGIPLHPLLHGV